MDRRERRISPEEAQARYNLPWDEALRYAAGLPPHPSYRIPATGIKPDIPIKIPDPLTALTQRFFENAETKPNPVTFVEELEYFDFKLATRAAGASPNAVAWANYFSGFDLHTLDQAKVKAEEPTGKLPPEVTETEKTRMNAQEYLRRLAVNLLRFSPDQDLGLEKRANFSFRDFIYKNPSKSLGLVIQAVEPVVGSEQSQQALEKLIDAEQERLVVQEIPQNIQASGFSLDDFNVVTIILSLLPHQVGNDARVVVIDSLLKLQSARR